MGLIWEASFSFFSNFSWNKFNSTLENKIKPKFETSCPRVPKCEQNLETLDTCLESLTSGLHILESLNLTTLCKDITIISPNCFFY